MEKFDLQRPIKLYWPFLQVSENWISKKNALEMNQVPLYRISQGESVNCDLFCGCFCVHAQATHTETLSHISTNSKSTVNSLEIEHFFPVLLWDFPPTQPIPNESSFDQLVVDLNGEFAQCKGIVIRCLPQDEQSFLPVELAFALNQTCIMHLFTNLVSVDAEQSKSLPFHRAFLSCNDEGFPLKSITELCCIDNELPCGLYLMCLTIWNCDSDASPSFPVLFPLKECK